MFRHNENPFTSNFAKYSRPIISFTGEATNATGRAENVERSRPRGGEITFVERRAGHGGLHGSAFTARLAGCETHCRVKVHLLHFTRYYRAPRTRRIADAGEEVSRTNERVSVLQPREPFSLGNEIHLCNGKRDRDGSFVRRISRCSCPFEISRRAVIRGSLLFNGDFREPDECRKMGEKR